MGIKWPFGKSPKYPPRDWTCPSCHKYHSKPHFAYPGQVDLTKAPTMEGRVKFNREGSQMDCDDAKKYDTPIKVMAEATGPRFSKVGKMKGLFCPHCGWMEAIINIVKVKT